MHTQTTPTGQSAHHAHHLAAFNAGHAHHDADLTPDDLAELHRIELHQTAYNQLGRARAALLHFSTDYAAAIAQAESAISALAALALMNGRA